MNEIPIMLKEEGSKIIKEEGSNSFVSFIPRNFFKDIILNSITPFIIL